MISKMLRRWSELSHCKHCTLLALAVAFFLFSYSNISSIYSIDFGAAKHSPPSTPAPTNISHVVFGIGASARTWQARKSYAELWWRPGVTRGHVWLDRAPPPHLLPWPAACPPYRVSADTSRFGKRAPAARIASIVKESYRETGGGADVRWFVMGDDDTVFFTENLVGVLGKYDHEEMYYIGAGSESVEQDVMHSYEMAYGGGGFAVSAAAARELARAMDGGCLERYDHLYGSDQRVHGCLTELGVPLTREAGFHQVDLRGDMYGMLAAHPIAPLVSLHHLDSVKPMNPRNGTQLDAVRSLMDASRLDPARTLQQTVCYLRGPAFNWSVSVSWGYTVQLYPRILLPRDLTVPLQTFKTWRSSRTGPFTFNTREIRPDHPCDAPMLFFLDGVEDLTRATPGQITATITRYAKHEAPEGNTRCDLPGFAAATKVKEITAVASRMDFNIWRKAPRRQCCQAQQRQQGKSIEVDIRECYSGEITSPP